MKQKITLVQKIANLKEYQNMINQKKIPLVLELQDYEVEMIKKSKNSGNQDKSDNFKQLEEIGKMYQYISDISSKEQNYLYLNLYYLRDLIEDKKIFIPDFLDYKGNRKYVDYIYKPYFLKDGSGIVFRDSPRILGITTDHFKLVKAVETKVGFKKGTIILTFSVPEIEHTELESLCAEIIRDEKDSKQLKKAIG